MGKQCPPIPYNPVIRIRENLRRSLPLTKVKVEEDRLGGGTSWLKWGEGEEPYSMHSGTWEGDPPIHTMDHNSEGHAVKLKVVPIGTGVNFKGLVKLKFGTMKPTIMLTITALRGH